MACAQRIHNRKTFTVPYMLGEIQRILKHGDPDIVSFDPDEEQDTTCPSTPGERHRMVLERLDEWRKDAPCMFTYRGYSPFAVHMTAAKLCDAQGRAVDSDEVFYELDRSRPEKPVPF